MVGDGDFGLMPLGVAGVVAGVAQVEVGVAEEAFKELHSQRLVGYLTAEYQLGNFVAEFNVVVGAGEVAQCVKGEYHGILTAGHVEAARLDEGGH